MSQQNKTTLQQSINTQLADNSAGEISAADIRSNMINITDSLVFNNEDQSIVGSIELTGDVTASIVSGSFTGDGSALTNITAEWDGSRNGNAEITGSLTVSGSGNVNILNGLSVYGASTGTEFFSTAYTSNRVVSNWYDLGGPNLQTEIDPGNISITSDFTDYLTLRNNGTVKALSRENGLRFTRLAFETGTITNDSVVTVPKDITGTVALELKGYTVSTLPTGAAGDRAYVTDALAPAFLVLVTGGGAITSPVFHNGTIWVCG